MLTSLTYPLILTNGCLKEVIRIELFSNRFIGGGILTKTCTYKKCKKPTIWVFFEMKLGFLESCEKHKNDVVQHMIKQMIDFDFRQANKLGN